MDEPAAPIIVLEFRTARAVSAHSSTRSTAVPFGDLPTGSEARGPHPERNPADEPSPDHGTPCLARGRRPAPGRAGAPRAAGVGLPHSGRAGTGCARLQ